MDELKNESLFYHTIQQLSICIACSMMQWNQQEPFLPEVNNRETIAAIEANNDIYYLQKRIEKFPLTLLDQYCNG